jgi:DNA-binding NtrC family response regulator
MRVLVLGRQPAMLQSALQRLTQEGYVATGHTTDEAIIQALHTGAIDLVVIGGGVEAASRHQIKAVAAQITPSPQVVDLYGPHHLLEAVNAARAMRA